MRPPNNREKLDPMTLAFRRNTIIVAGIYVGIGLIFMIAIAAGNTKLADDIGWTCLAPSPMVVFIALVEIMFETLWRGK